MSAASSPQATPKPTRRWYQYSVRTLLLLPVVLALVLSGVYSWPHVHRRYIVWKLEKYDDDDLTKLPDEEQQRIGRWMGDLIGEPYEACDKPTKTCPNGPPKYWLLHASVTPRVGCRMHVVQLERTIEFAGVPFCRIHILDYWGRVVGSIRFQIGGRRAQPTSATLDESQYGFLCLKVKTDGLMGKSCQFYYITDRYAELLRIERIEGKFGMGNGNQFDLRDKPPDWSDWKALVESPERLQQLRGLAALWSYDNLQHLTPVDGKTRLRLMQLSTSADPWVSEESRWALRYIADRREIPALVNKRDL